MSDGEVPVSGATEVLLGRRAVDDFPDPAAFVVSQVDCAVGALGKADRAVGGAGRGLDFAGEAGGEGRVGGGLAVLEVLEDDLIAVLRHRPAKGRSMERDESAAAILG